MSVHVEGTEPQLSSVLLNEAQLPVLIRPQCQHTVEDLQFQYAG